MAIGILFSRVTGLIRQRVFAHYFGQSDAADAFTAAYRIPNVLQNLFGEGALSASFIPVYAALLARGEEKEATRLAGAVLAVLSLITSVLVLVGVLFTPLLIAVVAPGFTGQKRELTILLVRISFPGVGLLVLSSWCLGILNSHHRFLLSYSAPVLSNVAMIASLVIWGTGKELPSELPRLAVILAWGGVVGSGLQFVVQLPAIRQLVPALRFNLHRSIPARSAVTNFFPVFISRGVVQISAYIDSLLASLLPTGAVTALANAQLLYTLPVSLFGMSVSAAELPTMSGAVGLDANDVLRDRLNNGLRQIAFFVVPSAVAFLALGDVIAAALFQTGRFMHDDAILVWAILAGSAVGLLASTLGRLYVVHLRLARHAHATALRDRPRHSHHGARVSLRRRIAAAARHFFRVGDGRLDRLRRRLRLARVSASAADAEHAPRPDGTACLADDAAVDRRRRGRRRGVGHQNGRARRSPGRGGGSGADAIRSDLFGNDASAEGAGGEKRGGKAHN